VHLALSPDVLAKDDLPGPCRADDSTIPDNDSFFDRAASTVHLFRATGVNYHDVVAATRSNRFPSRPCTPLLFARRLLRPSCAAASKPIRLDQRWYV
jgi:hypothetical protein